MQKRAWHRMMNIEMLQTLHGILISNFKVEMVSFLSNQGLNKLTEWQAKEQELRHPTGFMGQEGLTEYKHSSQY
jgi:hypothetical protein